MTAATLAAALLFASAPRIAVLPFSAGEGVTPLTAESVVEALVAELRKKQAAELITARQIEAVLGMERQKELLGCVQEACLSEIAGALDASQLVTGSLSRLGQSWLLQVQRVDARSAQVHAHASARVQGGVDGLLDRLPAMATGLWAGLTPPPPPPGVQAALPPPFAEQPYAQPVDRATLRLLTDGKGRYLAVTPFSIGGPHFAGDAGGLFLQRVSGGGREGEKAFSFAFWEPRGRKQAQGSFDFRDGRYAVGCNREDVPLTEVPAREAKKLLAQIRLYDVRWQRQAHALARDDEGNWYLADRARQPEDSEDFRVYLGEPGALQSWPAKPLALDAAGEILRAADGKLKIDRRKNEAEWLVGEARRKLTLLDLHAHAAQIYGPGGPYRGMNLGTPCDGHLP